MDLDALGREIDGAVQRVERCLQTWPSEHWEASLWPVPRTDPWIWPAPGTEPVPERTDESIQRFSAVWCVGYHCLWFLDFYATPFDVPFTSPEYVRGGPEELPFPAPDGAAPIPTDVVSRDVLLRYVGHGREKVRTTIATVTPDQLAAVAPDWHPRAGETFAEVLRVNLAHLVEHGGQMERFLDGLDRQGAAGL